MREGNKERPLGPNEAKKILWALELAVGETSDENYMLEVGSNISPEKPAIESSGGSIMVTCTVYKGEAVMGEVTFNVQELVGVDEFPELGRLNYIKVLDESGKRHHVWTQDSNDWGGVHEHYENNLREIVKKIFKGDREDLV